MGAKRWREVLATRTWARRGKERGATGYPRTAGTLFASSRRFQASRLPHVRERDWRAQLCAIAAATGLLSAVVVLQPVTYYTAKGTQEDFTVVSFSPTFSVNSKSRLGVPEAE